MNSVQLQNRNYIPIAGVLLAGCALLSVYYIAINHTRLLKSLHFQSNSRCPSDGAIEELALERMERIAQACDKVGWSAENPMFEISKYYWSRTIMVNSKYNLLFCGVPKNGNTNFKLYFGQLDQRKNYTYSEKIMNRIRTSKKIHQKLGFPRLSESGNYTPEMVNTEFDSSFKVTVIREPLERLVSAYKDKLTIWNHYQTENMRDCGVDIIRMVREGNEDFSTSEITKGEPPTLTEFFQYLLIMGDARQFNNHWKPQVYMSRPCEITYDFIIAMEDMSCSTEYLARKLTGYADVPVMPSRGKSSLKDPVLANVSRDLILGVLQKHYAIDYRILGYEMPRA